jgi:hypothetical protein
MTTPTIADIQRARQDAARTAHERRQETDRRRHWAVHFSIPLTSEPLTIAATEHTTIRSIAVTQTAIVGMMETDTIDRATDLAIGLLEDRGAIYVRTGPAERRPSRQV